MNHFEKDIKCFNLLIMKELKRYKILLKGEDRTSSVSEFQFFGNKCKVTFYSGKTFTYNSSNVKVIIYDYDPLDCLKYLKDVAGAVGLEVEISNGQVLNVLANSYERIYSINKNSIFGSLLTGKVDVETSQDRIEEIIFPFGFNASQKDAVYRALDHKISVIEGPPGTGKTQTILNIISNIVLRGETVAVVSGNNSATLNIFEKLQKSQLDFIAAVLGSRDNKEEFINAQKDLPELTGHQLGDEEVVLIKKELLKSHKEIEQKLKEKNKLAKLTQEFDEIWIERQHFNNVLKESPLSLSRKIEKKIKESSSQDILDFWLYLENIYKDSILNRIIKFFIFWDRRYRLVSKTLKNNSMNDLISFVQSRYYESKIFELKKEIDELDRGLVDFSFDKRMSDYTELSMKLFRSYLASKYREGQRNIYTVETLRNNSQDFVDDYPVILSTTYSLRNSLSNNFVYDYVIVDESSQVDICTGALALSCAKKVVIVGDLKQLPHVVDKEKAELTDSLYRKYSLPSYFRYKDFSLLSMILTLSEDIPRTLLREHYRCHPLIIGFCNKMFYENELIILTEAKKQKIPLLVYRAVAGSHERKRLNQRQIDMIKNEIIPNLGLNTEDESLGIITPYRKQTNALQREFIGTTVKADTVDKFQGQEKKIVILSTVDNEITDFTDDANRLNVAISRAIEQLILVVNDGDSMIDKNIGHLIKYIEYNTGSVIPSRIHSVFDYLYREYSKARIEFLAKYRKVSKFDSENLMYALVTSTLEKMGKTTLDVMVNVPLKMLFRDLSILDYEEQKFVMSFGSHVDLLIYNKVTKEPQIAIEVDGVAFHKPGSLQAKRDAMKNLIFEKYNLNLLRFRTDGSGEEEVLIRVLKGVQ